MYESDRRSSRGRPSRPRTSAISTGGSNKNPVVTGGTTGNGSSSNNMNNAVMNSLNSNNNGPSSEPAIWAARHVEWPIPNALSLPNYQKLLKASREAGTQLGIEEKVKGATTPGGGGGGGGGTSSSGSGGGNTGGDNDHNNSNSGGGNIATTATNTSSAGESSYFSGFMSRVLNPSSANDSTSKEDDVMLGGTGSSSTLSGSRPLRPPRSGCVATANSWMVAVMECPGSGTESSGPLRLVSRWNVRRMSGVDHWMALPPPVAGGDGRIVHVFVDPTGCHTLLSARNGEAYYHHSSVRTLQKLVGFGRNPDGSWSKDLNGVAASTLARTSSSSSSSTTTLPVQVGLSSGSYVTAVAWDRERGTEGTSRKILLGTSIGEIYEYMLVSPNANTSNNSAATTTSTTTTTAAAGASSSAKDEKEELLTAPILLHKLQSEAAVSGLIFERLRTGLLVLCCTSGKNKRTRFYTFYSAHSSSFRMVMADEAHASLVELPGSLDHADLRICNDNICMRTETGIYYGTIDRAQSGPAFVGGSMIVDSGILPYDDRQNSTHSANIPVSLALTPHHIITLSESNEVRFVNRVAQKVIQKERVELVATSQQQQHHHGPSSSTSERVGGSTAMLQWDDTIMGSGELMMDIRRPDQVWLRKARSLVHISSSQEDRDVWKYTLCKSLEMSTSGHHVAGSNNHPYSSASPSRRSVGGTISSSVTTLSEEEKIQEALFEQAKSLCTNPSQKAVVTAVRAEYHLSQGRAELAAKYLAQCPPVLEPFAETAVRLALTNLGIDDPHAYGGSALARDSLKSNLPLITYLSDKMRVGKNNNDKMTCTMIGAWLTELYLHERDSSPTAKLALSQFLSQNVHTMDAKTIMKILTSHDVSATDCAAFAAVSGDIATAVSAALRVAPDSQDGVVEALRILNEAPFELAESLYYKHASTLLGRAPILAGKSFLSRYTHGLSPTRLLPSFMHYERLRGERKQARQVAQAARGKNPFGSPLPKEQGIEESKTLERVDVAGSRDMFGGGVEVQIIHGTQAGSFVDDPNVSVRYLEGVIKLGCRSSAIYSFLISLYVQMNDEEPLFRFLSTHVPAAAVASDANRMAGLAAFADEGLSGPLDMSYALRTILGTGRHFRSAIKLYM